MAENARRIPRKIREKILDDAGGKCANPGCDNSRLEIHHIKQWAVYKTHDDKHMIAVCPACHDACHFGKMKITDEQLYQWKGISKEARYAESHIFVSSSPKTRISAGTVTLEATKERETVIFDLPSLNKLQYSVKDEWLKVSATLVDRLGRTVLKVTDNNIRINIDDDLILEQRPGRFRVTVPVNKFYLPATALMLMRNSDPSYGADGRIIAIDLEVIKPGQVRVQGFWPEGNAAIVITEKSINFCKCGDVDYINAVPISIIGEGDETVLLFDGAVNTPMFQFE
ncbi:HNH endonuclease [Pseudomonas sp. TH10]|uniref:HNH endonuclease n=1 Tax=Pseudomonas sp. TH10 TaxID=2796376 RepID=UPI0019125344|nr:HNH endonuclease signature motif containing protein [Pseudomonas sp. TH10]MBK5517962.1 HNH endonuclease [Pseudomonas sp. TH10]